MSHDIRTQRQARKAKGAISAFIEKRKPDFSTH